MPLGSYDMNPYRKAIPLPSYTTPTTKPPLGQTGTTKPDDGPGTPGSVPGIPAPTLPGGPLQPWSPTGGINPTGMGGRPGQPGGLGNLGPGATGSTVLPKPQVIQPAEPMINMTGPGPAMGMTEEAAPAPTPLVRARGGTPEMGSTWAPAPTPVPQAPPVSNQVAGVDRDIGNYKQQPVTDVGNLYASRLWEDITSANNPYVRSIREGAQRLSDRNSYGATRQAEEALAASGVEAGTSQYNRALAKASGTANAANRDLMNASAGAAREFYQQGMDRAKDWEDAMFGRAKGERDLALDVAKYGDTRADVQFRRDDDARLEGKGDKLAYVNSIQDPKARQAARNMYEKGEDPRGAGIFDNFGGITEPYRSATPGTVEREGLLDRVRSTYQGQVNPKTGKEWTDAEMSAEASRLGAQGLENEYRPLQTGATTAKVQDIMKKVRTLPPGQFLTPEEFDLATQEGAIPRFDLTNAPVGKAAVDSFLAQNPGGLVNLGGKQYRVIAGSNPRTGRSQWLLQDRTTSVTELQDENGNRVFLYGGQLHSTPPHNPGAVEFLGDIVPWF